MAGDHLSCSKRQDELLSLLHNGDLRITDPVLSCRLNRARDFPRVLVTMSAEPPSTASAAKGKRCRVGIVGFGTVGAHFVDRILNDAKISAKLELAFVWNRSRDKLAALPSELILEDLAEFASRGADVIVEVSHPNVSKDFGVRFLQHADYFVGSPTAFSDPETDAALRAATA